MMRLLTQRLKVYAAHQSIAPPISDEYNAKGESLETLRDFHNGKLVKGGELLSKYTFAQQIVMPLVVLVFVWNMLYHLFSNNKLKLVREPLKTDDDETENSAPEHSQRNMAIYTTIICSYIAVFYIISLDCAAVVMRSMETIEIYSNMKHRLNHTVHFHLDEGIAGLLLAEDLVVFLAMVIFTLCNIRCSKIKWYYIICGPIMCVVNHWYHILIGFIHTPHHATSILIFYGVIVITFVVTLRTTYYNLSKCLTKCSCKCSCKKSQPDESIPIVVEEFIAEEECSARCPARCSAECCSHVTKFLFLFLISLFVAGMFLFLAYLFILVPINNVIDDAPDRILAINQTILILFGAAITYKVVYSKKETLFDFLVKVEDKKQTNNAEWERKSTSKKREHVASIILDYYSRPATPTIQ